MYLSNWFIFTDALHSVIYRIIYGVARSFSSLKTIIAGLILVLSFQSI